MRSLLDVNVLIALLDPDHVFHDRAHAWYADHRSLGWASCPLAENGVVRIMSLPHYHPGRRVSVTTLVDSLRGFVGASDHEFWVDDISLLDPAVFDLGEVTRSAQLTDLYLLALAVRRGGRLVTFDGKIRLPAVRGATAEHRWVIG